MRADVAVKVFGDDMNVLESTARDVERVLKSIDGAAEVNVEQTTGLPMLTVHIDRDKTARYGLNIADVQDALATAVGGREAGTMFEGDRRFDIVVRLPEHLRSDLEAIRRLPIALPRATAGARLAFIPLGEVVTLELAPGPNQVSREDGKRRIVVSANVRGRDLGSFVGEATSALREHVKVPAGYWTRWGGQYENLQSATQRLQIVVPVALLLVFALLFAMFGNVCTDGRHRGPVAARDSAVDLRRRGLHRAVGRGRPQRAGDDRLHPQLARTGQAAGRRDP